MKNKLILIFIALFFASLLMAKIGCEETKKEDVRVGYNFLSFPIQKEIVSNDKTEKVSDWGMTGSLAVILILIFFIARAIKRILWSKRKIKEQGRSP